MYRDIIAAKGVGIIHDIDETSDIPGLRNYDIAFTYYKERSAIWTIPGTYIQLPKTPNTLGNFPKKTEEV
jgi:hypothetical protein